MGFWLCPHHTGSTFVTLLFTPITEALLRTLGRHSRQGYLLKVLRDAGLNDAALLRAAHDRTYPVAWPEHGLSLMLQCLDPQAPDESRSWGLHSITLDAQHWPGAWIKGLNSATVTPEELVELLAPNSTEALCMPEMVCLTVPGIDGQTWPVVALFDQQGKKLRSLIFTRTGEWIAASILPPWPAMRTKKENGL